MPLLGGKRVKIIRVDENSVEVIHIRRKGDRKHPDASHTVPSKRHRGSCVDHIIIEKDKARKRGGWLSRLFSADSDDDEGQSGESGGGLQFRW